MAEVGRREGGSTQPGVNMGICTWEALGRPRSEVQYDTHPFKFYNTTHSAIKNASLMYKTIILNSFKTSSQCNKAGNKNIGNLQKIILKIIFAYIIMNLNSLRELVEF